MVVQIAGLVEIAGSIAAQVVALGSYGPGAAAISSQLVISNDTLLEDNCLGNLNGTA